jgi:hypothetical protein
LVVSKCTFEILKCSVLIASNNGISTKEDAIEGVKTSEKGMASDKGINANKTILLVL